MTAREKRAEYNKKYRQSEKGKEKTRDCYKKYAKTEKGRETRKRNK